MRCICEAFKPCLLLVYRYSSDLHHVVNVQRIIITHLIRYICIPKILRNRIFKKICVYTHVYVYIQFTVYTKIYNILNYTSIGLDIDNVQLKLLLNIRMRRS